MLGAAEKRHLGVAALANGTTITCELRLDLALLSSPEYDILSRRVNSIDLTICPAGLIVFMNFATSRQQDWSIAGSSL